MKSAYLYVRVSTDEQKRKGYSLPEQEDRLIKYCESNKIEIRGVYREDFSAKTFNRPEWKKLLSILKKDKTKGEKNVLCIKWDRFSRNTQLAYEMIEILSKCNTKVMAIDQPVDLEVPESTVMLAVYLSVPEAENARRALNTSNGMRRAKLMGRYPCRAPIGFVNLTTIEGRKYIAPQYPEAAIIKWIFHQLAKNKYRMSVIRRMAIDKGFFCTSSYFSTVVRNPVYCGLIKVVQNDGEIEMIKGNHEALVSVSTFYEVQDIINTKRKVLPRKDDLKKAFFLTGLLICPRCGRKLCGSFSRGSRSLYPYYHCRGRCKTRISSVVLNLSYEKKIEKLVLSRNANELFVRVMDDSDLENTKSEFLNERAEIRRQISRKEIAMSKARNLFVEGKLTFQDFRELRKEYLSRQVCLKNELEQNATKLEHIDRQAKLNYGEVIEIFNIYKTLDPADKKHFVKFFPPENIDYSTGDLTIKLPYGLSKILRFKS